VSESCRHVQQCLSPGRQRAEKLHEIAQRA
jgi:hypothetical protein